MLWMGNAADIEIGLGVALAEGIDDKFWMEDALDVVTEFRLEDIVSVVIEVLHDRASGVEMLWADSNTGFEIILNA